MTSRYKWLRQQFGSGIGHSSSNSNAISGRIDDQQAVHTDFKPAAGGAAPSLSISGGEFGTTVVGGVQQKTVESSKLRLVFVVGLEGAGHHYIIKALEDTFQDHNEGELRLNRCPMSKPYILMNALAEGPENYTAAHEQASRDMSALALEEEQRPLTADGTTAAGGGVVATMQGTFDPNPSQPCYGVGMLSYPTFSGFDKVILLLDVCSVQCLL